MTRQFGFSFFDFCGLLQTGGRSSKETDTSENGKIAKARYCQDKIIRAISGGIPGGCQRIEAGQDDIFSAASLSTMLSRTNAKANIEKSPSLPLPTNYKNSYIVIRFYTFRPHPPPTPGNISLLAFHPGRLSFGSICAGGGERSAMLLLLPSTHQRSLALTLWAWTCSLSDPKVFPHRRLAACLVGYLEAGW